MSYLGPVDPKYRYFLHDLGEVLKERALEAQSDANKAPTDSPEHYYGKGRLMGFNEVISIMQQQAIGFDIPLADLQLDDLDPDRDLT